MMDIPFKCSVMIACGWALGTSSLACTQESPTLPSAPQLQLQPHSQPPAAPQVFSHERTCLGTRCTLIAYHSDAEIVARAFGLALSEVTRLDRLMTTWIADSDVSRINAKAGSGEFVEVSTETLAVLQKSLWVAEVSQGDFDITVGAFRGLWRFDQDNDGGLPTPQEVEKRRGLVDYRDLQLTKRPPAARLRRAGQRLTLGGIAKGAIVDSAVAVLREAGVQHFVFRSGGDLYASGMKGDRPWRVGIQDPRAPSDSAADASFAMVELRNAAFNTSGDYERFIIKQGRRYHHVLDPKTGQPVSHTRSVTVLAPTAFLADTLDTALFVMGAKRAMALVDKTVDVEAVIVDSNNQVHISSGLSSRLSVLRAPTDGI